ncbi:MAG: DAK2 domain-containing protein [Dehalococcoidia bacterium]
MVVAPPKRSHLDGTALREMFLAATDWLEQNAEAINAINVFPIPDGDTGTNMFLTMRATMDAAADASGDSAAAVARAMADGALMGARGNSGVILSQIIGGLAAGMAGKDEVDPGELADAFGQATQAAYKAVTNPLEGTILTVCRAAGEAALRRSGSPVDDITDILEEAVRAARVAVDSTPALLPVLKEAGVVDAGGQGLYVMFEGALSYLQGIQLTTGDRKDFGAIDEGWLAQAHDLHEGEQAFGYCTEFVIKADGLSIETMRTELEPLGRSLLVVGDEHAAHVHVHTQDPGSIISYATSLGPLARVKVDNMELQHQQLAARPSRAPASAISVVAVGVGDGIIDVLKSMGASSVVEGGQTMNPSTAALVEAIKSAPGESVIVLPNNKNIVMAARQAATVAGKPTLVVEARSIPQGIAALLSFSPDKDLEENARAMGEAARAIRYAEVCKAVRTVKLSGIDVREGDYIAMVDGDLVASTPALDAAVVDALDRMVSPDSSLVTLYHGESVTAAEASALAGQVEGRFPDVEAQVVRGGQPYYDYFLSVE